MKKENIILIGILALLVGGLIYSVSGLFTAGSKKTSGFNTVNLNVADDNNNNINGKFDRKTSNGQVSIDLTPNEFKNGKLYVDISVNTHTGNLADYDLMELTTLEFDGSSIKPSSVPRLSGHHLPSGTLIFDVGKEIENFKIIIKGIPDIEIREFEW